MLWKLLEFNIHRYLMSIDRSGCERAERHIEISRILWECEHCKTALPEDHEEWMAIHDLIADKITNHLPKTIGFDPFKDEIAGSQYDIFADRMFERLIKLDLKRHLEQLQES